jgi:hypothetical protein
MKLKELDLQKVNKLNVLQILVGYTTQHPQFPNGLTHYSFLDYEGHLWDCRTTDGIEDAKQWMNKKYERQFTFVMYEGEK